MLWLVRVVFTLPDSARNIMLACFVQADQAAGSLRQHRGSIESMALDLLTGHYGGVGLKNLHDNIAGWRTWQFNHPQKFRVVPGWLELSAAASEKRTMSISKDEPQV